MSYNDELGVLLDKLSREDLVYLATHILRCDDNEIASLGDRTLRQRCSNELRWAGGHSLVNIFRKDHELPYLGVVRNVARKRGVKFNDSDDVLMIERKILNEQVRTWWNNCYSDQKQQLTNWLKESLKGQVLNLTPHILDAIIKHGITKEAALSVLGIGNITSTVGSVLRYNVVQKCLLSSMYKYFGIATAGRAILGTGPAGIAMRAASLAGPVIFALSIIYTAHVVARPAYRKTVPAVLWLAGKRIELFDNPC